MGITESPPMLLRVYQAATVALLRPYTVRELPGWGKLYNRLASWNQNDLWKGAPTIEMRGREHGYIVRLDLSKWSDRLTYFLGRWSDIAIQHIVTEMIDPAGVIVDVGANRGDFALFASTVVRNGKVIAFEPNPVCRATLLDSIQRNGVNNINVRPFGLSDTSAELPLYVPEYNDGEATFAGENAFEAERSKTIITEVKVGDDVLQGEKVSLIKMDVEGFELHALRGLTKVLDRDRPLIIIEIAKSHLARAGTTPQEVISLLQRKGYSGAKLGVKKAKTGHTYNFESLDDGSAGYDAFWMHRSHPRFKDFKDLPLRPFKGL